MHGIIADMAKSAKASSKPDGPHLFIKEHMDARGLSDEVVAATLGITPNALWKRYTDQARLTPHKINALAEAIGVHRSELNFPPGTESLDALATTVSPNRRKQIADIVKRLAQED